MRFFGRTFSQHAATPLLVVCLAALAAGCGEASNPPSAPASTPVSAAPSAPSPQFNAGPVVVPLVTYDGSGQAVHPDGVVTPDGWGGGNATVHVVATPYPGGAPRFENPSYYDVPSPTSWVAPDGVVNPLASPSEGAHLSDPDMLYDPGSHSLWVYYREASSTLNRIYVIHSADGTHWSTPVVAVEVPRHFAISPAVVRRAPDKWLMWTVNGGTDGCTATATTVELRYSSDGLVWSPPTAVQIGKYGEFPWHIEVEWIPSRHEYWAVYNAKASGSCMTSVVRFATSPDGVTWTEYASPLLRAGAIPEFQDVVYRSSISYDPTGDMVTVLYSGARADNGTYTWRVATEQLDLRTLMARITAPPQLPTSRAVIAGSRAAPELTNETAP